MPARARGGSRNPVAVTPARGVEGAGGPGRSMTRVLQSPRRIAVVYVAFGALWILLSDSAARWISPDAHTFLLVETYKGWLFIAITALLLDRLIRRFAERSRIMEETVQRDERMKLLGTLAATITHEFNNTLMSCQPFVEVLRRRCDADPTLERAISQIERALDRGAVISGEILRFARPAPLQREKIAIREFLREITEEMRPRLRKGVRLVIDAGSEEVTARLDGHQLHQVVANLILNAQDAMPSGGEITLACHSGVRSRWVSKRLMIRSHELVHLEVRDQGFGIEPGDLARIFEPLFTTKRSGTGLGLAVVHQIVTRHGGEIIVESRVAEGTTFHVVLPEDGT